MPRPIRRPPTFPIPSPPPPPATKQQCRTSTTPAPISSNIDIVNEPADGPSNSSTPRNIRNRLFYIRLAGTGGTGLSPNRNMAAADAGISAEATPIANRIADLLGVALFNEITGARLSPVTVIPTDRQIREATELITI